MKTATLVLTLLVWSVWPARSSAQVLWMGSGPVHVGGYYAPVPYGASYYPGVYGARAASPFGYGAGYSPWRTARAWRAESAPLVYRAPLAAPVQYLVRDSAIGGSANIARTHDAKMASSGVIQVTDYGLGKREKDILKALDEANAWAPNPKDLLKAITTAAANDTGNDVKKKAKLAELIGAYEKLAKDVMAKKADFDVISKVMQDLNVANQPVAAELKATLKAVGEYVFTSRQFLPQPPTIDDPRRTAIVGVLQDVIEALKR